MNEGRKPEHVPGKMTVTEVAVMLGVSRLTIWRMMNEWYGPIGAGTYRSYHLDPIDVMVCRAWKAINGSDGQSPPPQGDVLRHHAMTAIRSDPRRWLLLTTMGASTHDSAGDAAGEWLSALTSDPLLVAWIIDLENDLVGQRNRVSDLALSAQDRSPHEPFTGAMG